MKLSNVAAAYGRRILRGEIALEDVPKQIKPLVEEWLKDNKAV